MPPRPPPLRSRRRRSGVRRARRLRWDRVQGARARGRDGGGPNALSARAPPAANTELAPGVRAAGDLHVTGSAYSREPGGGCFCLDVKGGWVADGGASGTWHVPRLASDPEFEAGVGPVCVEVAATDGGGGAAGAVADVKRVVAERAAAAVACLRQGTQQAAARE